MTTPKHVVLFDATQTSPQQTRIQDPEIVDTPYISNSWRHFTSSDGRAISGIWEAEPHLERCQCDFDEMCHLLEGTVRLTGSQGNSQQFCAGDSFVVEKGFSGTWENLTYVKKVFFILNQ